MDIYITFYRLKNTKSKKIILINNAFSFGRDKKPEDMDLFFDNDDPFIETKIKKSIDFYKPDKIWVSLTYDYEILSILNIIDKRWILGGPLVSCNIKNKKFENFFNNIPTFVYTSMEEYLGKEISSDFDPYFLDFVRKEYSKYVVLYNLCVGFYRCYWSKCTFCSYRLNEKLGYNFKRKDIQKISKSAIPFDENNIFISTLCMSSIDSKTLNQILSNNKKSIIQMTMRADRKIINVIKKYDNLRNYIFTIGLEGLSQQIINELNKGIKIENVFEITKEILKRNGFVRITLMKNYTFLTKEIVEDCKKNIENFEEIGKKYSKNKLSLEFVFGLPVLWFDIYNAEKYGFKSIPLSNVYNSLPFQKEFYLSDIPTNSEQYKFNQEIADFLNNSSLSIENWELGSIEKNDKIIMVDR